MNGKVKLEEFKTIVPKYYFKQPPALAGGL
jgi:hypothetical protein